MQPQCQNGETVFRKLDSARSRPAQALTAMWLMSTQKIWPQRQLAEHPRQAPVAFSPQKNQGSGPVAGTRSGHTRWAMMPHRHNVAYRPHRAAGGCASLAVSPQKRPSRGTRTANSPLRLCVHYDCRRFFQNRLCHATILKEELSETSSVEVCLFAFDRRFAWRSSHQRFRGNRRQSGRKWNLELRSNSWSSAVQLH